MSRLWIDVTTVLGWHRHAVGIVRTEAECALHALKLRDSGQLISFCRFDRAKGFSEVKAENVSSALSRIFEGGHKQSDKAPQGSRQKMPLEKRLKDLAFRVLNWLPFGIKPKVYNFLLSRRESILDGIAGARKLKQAARLFFNPRRSPIPQGVVSGYTHINIEACPFEKGDTYLSMGLDWDQKDWVYLYELKKNLPIKVVLFCYDIIPVKFPHLCVGDVAAKFAKYYADMSWVADKVLCISDCSRGDLISLLDELGAPLPSTAVVKLGAQVFESVAAEPSSEISALLNNDYILFVSTIERRKNHETLYRAYARLVEDGVPNLPLLVFVGMPGWGVSDFLSDVRLDPRTQGYIKTLDNVSDSDLAILYRRSLMTVFPSLYEGWGLPVAESLSFGKFCLASSAASIPEVGGELIEYLDPLDVPAWARRLEWYISKPERILEREEIIRANYKPLSWSDAASLIISEAVS